MKKTGLLLAVAIAALVVIGGVAAFYVFAADANRATSGGQTQVSSTATGTVQNSSVIVTIPPNSSDPPPGFNVTNLLTGAFQYPYDFKVVIGVNNTVHWKNADDVSHTVSSFVVPTGAQTFNSDLIAPGSTFSATLTVPGTYKYTCMWHPWLAGVITVASR